MEEKPTQTFITKLECNQREEKITSEVNQIKHAIFGDNNGTKGMKEMVEEMHEVFTRTRWTGRVILKAFIVVGTIAGTIIGLRELFKR